MRTAGPSSPLHPPRQQFSLFGGIMRVYLSGPMSGYNNHNFEAFNEMAAWLRARGHEVVNPAEMGVIGDENGPYETHAEKLPMYLRRDLPAMLTCDGVVLLDGWGKSRGACAEVWVAKKCGLDFYVPTTASSYYRALMKVSAPECSGEPHE